MASVTLRGRYWLVMQETSACCQRYPIGKRGPARFFAGLNEKNLPAEVENGPGNFAGAQGWGLGDEIVFEEKKTPVVIAGRLFEFMNPAPDGRSGNAKPVRYQP